MKNKTDNIVVGLPKEVFRIISKLKEAEFDAYIVGGCLRDLLLEREINDWDVVTNAKPKQVQVIFKKSIYENNFGTVGILTGSKVNNLKIVEVTTYRQESDYKDKRHPEKIKFLKELPGDLMRRDFTINALAFDIKKTKELKTKVKCEGVIIDIFEGIKDLKNKIIRAVGCPKERFEEDALRMLRAVRFAAVLGFCIEEKTFAAILEKSPNLKFVSKERIRDEFIKIVMSEAGSKAIALLCETKLMNHVIPEILEAVGVDQNLHHIYTVYEHLLRSFDYAVKQNCSLEVRLAALLHDIGKPKVKRGKGKTATFYNHEVVGAKMTRKILERLKFPNYILDKIVLLVDNHQFFYDPLINTDASIRHLLAKVKKENILELSQLREADRIGSGCPKALPFRLRHFLFRVEKVLNELDNKNLSLKTLKLDGHQLMKMLDLKPGPKLGYLLNILLSEIIDDLKLNNIKHLTKRAKELNLLDTSKLKDMSDASKTKYENLLKEEERKIKKKYGVS